MTASTTIAVARDRSLPLSVRGGGQLGGGYKRLVQVKRRWEPDNLFRLNQNIVP